ncbi:MAG: universal stress protein [Syntrophaceae bacterium]|nr:universal stress protein [Syntrophaceae bacterium]
MFKKILFCTDFSENSDWAFKYALNLARTYQAKLLILHVIPPDPVYLYPDQLYAYLPEERIEEYEVSEKEKADRELNSYYIQRMNGFKDYKVIFKKGVAFYEIIQTAREESIDLIVMGTHGRTGLDHILFGSTAEKVVRKSPYPVLTVRLPGKKFVMP